MLTTAASPRFGSVTAESRMKGTTQQKPSLRNRLCQWGGDARERTIMMISEWAIVVAAWIGRRPQPIGPDGCEIMLTGRFDSINWILAHLGPLAASKECKRLWMVSTNPVPDLPKVTALYPPKWLVTVAGATLARLLTFLWAALHKRPHVVGGFHLMYNGIAAAIAGRLAGARSMYFCIGGTEVANDGVIDQPNCFIRKTKANARAQRRRLAVVSAFDTIVTMGTRAARFFQDHGVVSDFHVVSGGIDSMRFHPAHEPKPIDLILTARLSSEKRIDIFLQAVRLVAGQLPDVRAVIVGDGHLRAELEQMVAELGVQSNVTFTGHQNDVENWLGRSKIFVLTSDLEGLALSVIEAMMSGLPAVVSDVGDLGDLVESGVNGYLVPRRSPQLLAGHLLELLSDGEKLKVFSHAAHQSAMRYEKAATTQRWDRILSSFRT
ncbi:glycosyltransferase family 4 protein [Anaerobaca lacustris]|uniref:Glycosyltransferase n=1 Tax=Anaerobaca lacustris TaxID=3044600 RepID=A0AAW6TWL6_9BACT|nr:glycosyltransferase [Sedimentisphaerales bacterium M17dextr]